jgi:hypothetical protein
MAKTILIATDYSLESLNILKKVLKEKDASEDQNQYNILLVSGYDWEILSEIFYLIQNNGFQ